MRRHRLACTAVVGLVVAVVAGCGTTVPQTTQLGSTAGSGIVESTGGLDATGVNSGGDPAASGDQSAGTTVDGVSTPAGAPGSSSAGTPTAGASAGSTGAGSGGAPGPVSSIPGDRAPAPAPGQPSAAVGSRSSKPSASSTQGPRPTTGSKAAPTAGGAPAGGKAGASTAPAAAGPSSTAPLKIGFVYYDASTNAAANSAAGATTMTTVTLKGVTEAIKDYVNSHGGLDGRQVTLVEVPESDQSNSYDTDATAACQMLSQDTPVPVVIDTAYGPGSGFAQCLSKAGVEDLDMVNTADSATLASMPFVAALQYMSPDRSYVAAVDQLAKTGYLGPSNKVGVFMDTCPTTMAAYIRSVLPDLKRQGLNPVQTSTTPCIGGYGGLGQASRDSASAVLAFQSNKVDRVMVVSTQDSTYYTLFNVAANSQQYTPGYVMTTTAQAGVQAGSFQAGQRPGIHGAGFLPALDASNAKVPGTPIEATCDQMALAEQVAPSSVQDYYFLALGCSPFVVLQAAFKADGANATASVLSKAIAGLGVTVSNPGTLGGTTDFSHPDAPRNAQVFAYQAACSCVSYTGSPAVA